jgi:cysteine-rich repeat protein
MRLAIAFALLAGCTDFQFADDLSCSGLGNCPPGLFCDSSADVCRTDLASCGDGTPDDGEVCDDGNRASGDGCRADCLKAELCGDGVQDPQEPCDDGNTSGADGCSATCALEGCGNNVVDEGEECDDGVANGETAACLPTCVIATCGDGFLRAGVEACDDGAANSDTAACLSTCVVASCGDGHVRAGVEACDDDNDVDTDGCLTSCAAPSCGDGNVQIGVELCDNDLPFSRCNASCTTDKVIQVVAGLDHTCALRAGGKVRCWGVGTAGQLGHASVVSLGDDEPPAPAGDIDLGGIAIQLAAGDSHTCALLEGGTVRCWGVGADGRLGYGNTSSIGDDETPASAGDVVIGGTVTQITAGAKHTCALLSTGAVRCWGAGADGRLGYGTTTTIGDTETPASAGDVNVGGAITQIVAGNAHTCAVLATGKVRCWGAGADGRLGYGNTTTIGDTESPASAGDVSLGGAVVQLAAGERHTCAVLATADVKCWGAGADGRLGHGNTLSIGDDEVPSTVGTVSIGEPVARIAAGARHTCALLTGGEVRCWGTGIDGRLGTKSDTTVGDDELPSTGLRVKTGNTATAITAGPDHTCVLTISGDVVCWGSGAGGKLGYAAIANVGDDEDPSSAGSVFVMGAVMQVSAGEFFTCVIGDAGQVRCWGANTSGELGYGHTQNLGDDEPVALIGDVDVGGPVIQVAAGSAHACALLATRTVRCWGSGNAGRLGYGNQTSIGDDEAPATAGDVDVGGPVKQIAAGSFHSCALLETGAVRCWGTAFSGQLGYGNTNNIGDDETPASAGDVDVGGTVIQISAGGSHTCALLDTGNVRCWGFGGNQFGGDGRLGYGTIGTIGDDETPASAGDVPVGGPVAEIVANTQHTCARLVSGSVRCWGHPLEGRIGYGNNLVIGDDETPASVGDVDIGGVAIQISGGAHNSCALLDTGNVRCWGSAASGRLGFAINKNIGDNETPASAGDTPIGGIVTQVDTGNTHSCARLANGRLRCWGFNGSGQLGRGDTNNIGDVSQVFESGDVPAF